MRTLARLITILAICALAVPAFAQQNNASLIATIQSNITSNNNNQITAATLRNVLGQMANSTFQYNNSATPPIVSNCGTSPVIAANSMTAGGSVTTGTGTPTTCQITFGLPYTLAAYCVIAPASANAATLGHYISAQSVTGFTLTMSAGTNAASWNWNCEGQ